MGKRSRSEEAVNKEEEASGSILKRGTAFYGVEGALKAWAKDFPSSEKTITGEYVKLAGDESNEFPETSDEAN